MVPKIILGVVAYGVLYILTSFLVENIFPSAPPASMKLLAMITSLEEKLDAQHDHIQKITNYTESVNNLIQELDQSSPDSSANNHQEFDDNVLEIRHTDFRFMICTTEDSSSCKLAGKITTEGKLVWLKSKFELVGSF